MKILIKPKGAEKFEIDVAKDAITVGRSQRCNIRLSDSKISRVHCVFENKDGNVLIRDLNSKNGIKVNGRLQSECSLKTGDVVLIGHAICLCASTAS